MALFPRPVRPSRALADFKGFFGARRRHQLVYVAASIGCTVVLMLLVWQQFAVEPEWKPPQVTYVEQWPASRTIVDVRARLAKDAPRERAAKAAEAAAAEQRRQEFARLAKKLGLE